MDVKELVVKLHADIKDFQANMSAAALALLEFGDDADKTEKKHESMMGSFVKGGLIIEALKKGFQLLSNAVRESITEAKEREEIEVKLGAALQSTGHAAGLSANELKKMAQGLSDLTGYEDDAILESETLLLRFTKIGKEVFPQAQLAIMNVSAALGRDLKSVAETVGRSLENPIAAMRSLRSVNVVFTEEQRKMVEALQESGDMLGAQQVVLNQLEKSYGGTAVAIRQTFGGALRAFNTSLKEAKETIGKALLPVLQSLIDIIMPIIREIAKLDTSTIQIALGFVGLGAAVFGAVKAFGAIQGALSAGLGPLQVLLMGVAAVGAAVTIFNEASNKARVIHGELADKYVQEYNAIDGQVKRYEELKNKTKLSAQEKKELIGIEHALKRQLGEESAFIKDQSGKWKVNATAVSMYKKERLDLAIREAKAQAAVADREQKWAVARDKAFQDLQRQYKESGLSATDYAKIQIAGPNTALAAATVGVQKYAKYLELSGRVLGFQAQYQVRAGADMVEMESFVAGEVGKTIDQYTEAKGKLEALTTAGVKGYADYTNSLKDNDAVVLQNTDDTKKLNKSQKENLKLGAEADRAAAQNAKTIREKYDLLESALDKERELAVLEAQEKGQDVAAIERKYAEESTKLNNEKNKEIQKSEEDITEKVTSAWLNAINTIGNALRSIFGDIEGAISGYYDRLIQKVQDNLDRQNDEIDAWEQEQLKKYDADEGANQRLLQKKIADLKKALAQEKDAQKKADIAEELAEAEKELGIIEVQNEAQKKREEAEAAAAKRKAQLEYKSAHTSWALQLTQAIASGAMAIVNGFATMPFIPNGLIAGAAATAATGVQIGVITANEPKPPKFASGGFASGLALVGEQGPELARFPAGTRIYNSHETRQMTGGDTFIFQSPKAIDPSEAQTLIRRTMRDLRFQGVVA